MRYILTTLLFAISLGVTAQDVKVIGPKRNHSQQTTKKVVQHQKKRNVSSQPKKEDPTSPTSTLPNSIPSYSKAADLYRLAIEGDKDCMCRLGKSFLNGENGVRKDYDEAFCWLKKAAELDHPNAMAWLADCYYEGWGCDKNYNQTFFWNKKSAEKGDPYGWYNLEAHKGRMVATNNNSCGSTTRACIYVFN